MGEKRDSYRILVGKPEGKIPLGRPRRRCVDNVKMDLRERPDGVVRIGLIWLRIGTIRAPVKAVMYIWVPLNSGKFLSSYKIDVFSRWAQLHAVG
jgi:hypothetical protein